MKYDYDASHLIYDKAPQLLGLCAFSRTNIGRRNGGWTCTNSSQNYCPGGTSLYGWFATWQGSRLTSSADTSLNQGASYGYDDFNRLTSRTITTGAAQNYTYTYDLYGNRWAQTPLNGGNSSSLSFDATTNQVNTAGFAYDAAGNMTADGTGNQYSYDAEGNLIQEVAPTGTMKFTYDALNRQIRTDVPAFNVATENIFNSSGQLDTVWEVGTGRIIGKTYWGSTPVQSYDTGTNMAFFQHRDWNGSERLITNASGTVTDVQVSLPFGDGFANTSGSRDNTYDGYDGYWDGVTKITNHTQYREYANNQGRWLQPDPYDGSYDFSNPQSFNRYAYAGNNPLYFTDPSGQDGGTVSGPVCYAAVAQGGANPGADVACGITALVSWLFFDGLFGGPSFHGSLHPRPNADPGSLGESLGIPYSIPTGQWGIAPTLGLPDAGCEFGACGAGPTSGYQAQAAAPVLAAPICAIAEPCGAIVLGAAIAATAVEGGVIGYQIYQRNRTNVSDTGITSEAQQLIAKGLATSMCEALAILQKQTRDSARLQKIKATQKAFGCRRSSAQS